jgi:DNA-binding phage protein
MNKKKTLKKREFSLENIPHIKLHDASKFCEEKPEEFFKDHTVVAEALLQCLIENDTEAFIEILDSYLRVNRSQLAEHAGLPRSTISLAFSKRGNPTLKTIAKIVHEAVSLQNR